MKTKIGWWLVAGMLGLAANLSDATAGEQINVHGIACYAKNGSQQGDLEYVPAGVRVKLGIVPREIACAVARTSPTTGPDGLGFFVDGSNNFSQTTSCTIYSYDFTGSFLGSAQFSSTSANYDNFLSLPPANTPAFAYIGMICTIPGNTNGTMRGVTVFDL
jgi:hypothetical protein